MSERPFTIASDKPAEINLEDMERYASSCQPESNRIAKFPTTSSSTSTSTFFCSLDDDAFVDLNYSEIHSATSAATAHVHPDHKIYRANGGTSPGTILKNVFSKAGNRRSGLRVTESVETLECSDEQERVKQLRPHAGNYKVKKKLKSKSSRAESSSEVDEVMSGCVATQGGNSTSSKTNFSQTPSAYYKQGSSGLGARIAQSDYADPTVLFAENILKRAESLGDGIRELETSDKGEKELKEEDVHAERRESEADSFYEKSFEIIENYVDPEADEVFRDSAIFSDMDEVISGKIPPPVPSSSSIINRRIAPKVAPPVPAKRKPDIFTTRSEFLIGNNKQQVADNIGEKAKPAVAQKPNYLRAKSVFKEELETTISRNLKKTNVKVSQIKPSVSGEEKRVIQNPDEERDDVSAGQSRAGWVRKMVGQLQGQEET